MLRRFGLFALLTVLSLCVSQINAQDLFNKKKGGLANAFSKSKSDGKKTTGNKSGYTMADLEKFVKSNKNIKDVKKIGERAFRFDFKFSGKKAWTLPTYIEFSKSDTNLWFTFMLDTIDGNPKDYPDRLLKMLTFNGSYGDSFFSIWPKNKQITLVGAIQLHGKITDAEVLDQLNYLGRLADRNEELWNTRMWNDAPKYVGSWKATGGVNMTIKLDRNGKFELVTNGNKTVGSYKIGDGKIEMTEKGGETITGKIDFTDANNFNLEVGDNKIKFVRQ